MQLKNLKYLLTGSKGQLGKEFVKIFDRQGFEYTAVDIEELDISDYIELKKFFSYFKPDVIINCAAYNNVDGAESDYESAEKVNSLAPKYLAEISKQQNSFLVHFSSDYVFDGMKTTGLYTENDKVNPINKYGQSKLDGENYIRNSAGDYLIFRLSWVFGEGQQNFIYKFREWAKSNVTLNITSDEVSVPTYAKMVAGNTMKALEKGLTGLYHLTNSGYTSRLGWAEKIINQLELNVKLNPVEQSQFNLPAIRPKISAMSNEKISDLLNISIPTWDESVTDFLTDK
ncbi:dTDP-4-dehydrorhamnose reductase [Bacteroidota bacterium]